MISTENQIAGKPKLRGYFHQEAFFMALGACVLLVLKSSSSLALISSLVYSLGLLTMLGVSSVYHRFNWAPKQRTLLKRLDHSAIFILIAGTFTPICLLALSESSGQKLFIVIWSAATLGACVLLVLKSSNSLALISSLVYSLGLLTMLGVSSVYHRFNWAPKQRALLKRLDHSAIFILIAGTFTPICLLALSESSGQKLFIVIWSAAILGVLQSIFWVKAPKIVTAIFYVIMGWLAFPYLGELQSTLGVTLVALMLAGGIVYTVGAVFYALKKPNLIPGILGYHELFHLFTIIGAAFHFAMIYRLIH